MSRIPNPFIGGDMHSKPPQTPSQPGFLLMTRPPSSSQPWRGVRAPSTPSQRHAHTPSDSGFIPFSSGNNTHDRRGRGGRFSRGNTPRHFTPYHQSQSPRAPPDWSFNTPVRHHYTPTRPSGGRDSFNSFSNPRHGRFSFNSNFRGGGGGGGRERGPISDIPVEKFVSASMVCDPWAEFDLPIPDPLTRTLTVPLLDDSEIVIDSDTSSVVVIDSDTSSVMVDNSYEVSVTEGDSSPVADTGSESPSFVTSDKDAASDSTGDD